MTEMKTWMFMWMFVVGQVHSQPQDCSGWFGSPCMYKCRCNGSCQADGSCTTGNSCQIGWFGPACQYADLAYSVSVTVQPGGNRTSLLTDNKDVTCNPYNTSLSLTLTWGQDYLLSWLKVYAQDTGSLPSLTVQFSSSNGSTYSNMTCHKNVIFNSPSMDIFCDLNVPVSQVVLTGEAVKSLCSLYISGGRNVALGQITSQSGTFTDNPATYGPQKAVDGDNSGDFTRSCTCTDGASNPFWYTNISRPVTVYRYLLYNRIDSNQYRLKGFQLTSFNVQGLQLYNYTDTSTQPNNTYTVVPNTPTSSVSRVTIQGSRTGDKFLTLCEVEIYGETECVAGSYGRKCENTCNCANNNEKCYVSTGGCRSGCAAGFNGDDCKQPCDSGWFGTSCRYQCHCNTACDSDGSCTNGGRCETGWFGPACQYVDLAVSATGGSQLHDLIDGNDATCNTDVTSQNLTLTWSQAYLFTWLRVYTGNMQNVDMTVQFRASASTNYFSVPYHKIVTSNSSYIDIVCNLNVPVNQVLLTGESVKSLCSLYISGGRNVALHQTTSQSTTYNEGSIYYSSEKAVDGNTNGSFGQNSCTTSSDSSRPYWSVKISRPATVYRYVLYNRDYLGERLQMFKLQSFNKPGVQVFSYTDSGGGVQDVYTVVPGTPSVSVSRVDINSSSTDHILTLCEVEIYGETECVAGRYGRECENTCNCANTTEKCYVSTGGCLSGCAVGYYGEGCKQLCPDGTFGQDCKLKCSVFCDINTNNRTCHLINGTCLLGCREGYHGDICDKPCLNGTFGKDCRTNCSQFCVTDKNGIQACDRFNGTCVDGCQFGYTTPWCNQTCSDWAYGQDCKKNCSMHCYVNSNNRNCDLVNGICLLGCQDGYYGDKCDKECLNGMFGKDCKSNCSQFCVTDTNGIPACDRFNGSCLNGCDDGYTTLWCNKTCDAGWFGPSCVYKCRCDNTTCETNGSCTPGSQCQSGWFGPACQYADLAAHVSVTIQPGGSQTGDLTDGNDNTCNTATASQNLTLTWSLAYLLTWLRVYTNNVVTGSLSSLTVQFSLNGSTYFNVTCNKIVTINSTFMDIFCEPNVPVNQVLLTGDAVKSLCSLYISGGRNVALQQHTSQSSTYGDFLSGTYVEYESEKAVDGNTDGNFKGGSCTATNKTTNSSWTVYMSRPVTVYRYVLYNREDSANNGRLQGFTLDSLNASDAPVYSYTDPNGPAQIMYTLLPGSPTLSVSRVNIWLNGDNKLLTLCEVEIYGETECVAGRYGRECNGKCNCANTSEKCYVSTGGCLSGCAAGYHGEDCTQICPKETYGKSCMYKCSISCVTPTPVSTNRSCDRVNGTCLLGCQDGYMGEKCEKVCPNKKFGKGCLTDCPENCVTNSSSTPVCHHINGTCLIGCQDGYLSNMCDQRCPSGQYGRGCASNCSQFCAPDNSAVSNCRHTDGACLKGCLSDYQGVKCDEANNSENTLPVGAIVGAVLGGIIAAALIVVGAAFILWRRRKAKSLLSDEQSRNEDDFSVLNRRGTELNELNNTGKTQKGSKPKRADAVGTSDTNTGVYYNTLPELSSTIIQLKDLETFLATHNKSFYQEQFSTIPINSGATTTEAQKPENKKKNRYKNICAYDHSRVHLVSSDDHTQGNYINASHIQGYNGENFIASQGPTKSTLEDFVRMLWEQQTEEVVMLTNLIEQGKDKCERYWPEDGEMKVGEITVKLTTSHVFADYTIRRLQLAKAGKPNHKVTHFHFTAWPDLDVPVTPWGLVDFEQRVATYPTSKPIVVHCSAGVGRTGTFIALRNVMRQAADKGYLDIFTTVQKLRHDRVNMVQTSIQYQFLHSAAQVAMLCMGTTVTSDDIGNRINYLEEVLDSGLTNMEQEFKTICDLSNNDDIDKEVDESAEDDGNVYVNNHSITNKHKNRLNNIIPKTLYAPILQCETDYLGDYINAVFVPSFSKQNQQFLTQLPLPTTVTDFWRLVTQYKVSLIVSFEDDLKATDLTIGVYLPSHDKQTVTFSLFELESETVSTSKLWQQRKVTITADTEYKNSKVSTSAALQEELTLTHLKCMTTDLDPESLLALVGQIRSLNPGNESRTVYTCRNGADYSGLVCVLSLLLDRMDHDGCSTVPLVVGAIKAIRPQVIPTLAQYRLLYQVLHLYSDRHSVYANLDHTVF